MGHHKQNDHFVTFLNIAVLHKKQTTQCARLLPALAVQCGYSRYVCAFMCMLALLC